ncbi:neural cell adhesion molecule 1-like isoform X2 [Oscarella lobularis]|uniref:neural cell adhesion molecule 1-like isoform X2 n=1 Tax=Oscarella lobularis TaxID=121494 RepID=UPI0033137FE9
MSFWTFLLILVVAMDAYVKGATTREKAVVVANMNDSFWALNGDAVVLNCTHPATSGDIWSQQATDGTESAVPRALVRTFNGGSALTVTMSPSLNGISYKCVLQDFRRNVVFESGWITLLLGVEINMTCASQATVCATETQTLTKRCAISGLPAPNITVRKISGPASSLPLASLSGLTFSAVTLKNRGNYTITGQNILEDKQVNVSVQLGVDICVAPTGKISIPDTIFCLNLALINYTAKGIPAPNITWNSSLAERAVVHTLDEYSTGITSFVESTLEITAKREDNQISFCVTAENSVASTSQCYSRNVICSAPGAPFVQVVDIGDTSFNLNIIEPQFNGGNEVLSYNISVNRSDTQLGTYNVNRTGKLYVVRGLSPNTNYTISVTAVNIIGEGPPFTFNNKTAGRPGGVGERDVVKEKGCKELSFSFMEKDDNGGPITNYRVLLYSEQDTDVLLRNESSSSATVTINGLDPKTMYEVRLQVENEYGESNASAGFIVTTDSCGLGAGAIVGISLGSGVVLIAGTTGFIMKKKSGGGGSKDSSQELKKKEKKPPIVVDHDVKVEEAQYDVTGRNLVTGKEDNGADGGGPIPGSVNNPSPKEVKHTKGPAGENYAQLDKGPPKQDYAKPDVTKKRKAQKEVYAELDHEESGQAAAKPSPKVVDKSEKTIYADMNPEQPKPRDHYDP